jgi:hypothetical protein
MVTESEMEQARNDSLERGIRDRISVSSAVLQHLEESQRLVEESLRDLEESQRLVEESLRGLEKPQRTPPDKRQQKVVTEYQHKLAKRKAALRAKLRRVAIKKEHEISEIAKLRNMLKSLRREQLLAELRSLDETPERAPSPSAGA